MPLIQETYPCGNLPGVESVEHSSTSAFEFAISLNVFILDVFPTSLFIIFSAVECEL